MAGEPAGRAAILLTALQPQPGVVVISKLRAARSFIWFVAENWKSLRRAASAATVASRSASHAAAILRLPAIEGQLLSH